MQKVRGMCSVHRLGLWVNVYTDPIHNSLQCVYIQHKLNWDKCQQLQQNIIKPNRLPESPVCSSAHSTWRTSAEEHEASTINPSVCFFIPLVCVCLFVCVHKRLWILIFSPFLALFAACASAAKQSLSASQQMDCYVTATACYVWLPTCREWEGIEGQREG